MNSFETRIVNEYESATFTDGRDVRNWIHTTSMKYDISEQRIGEILQTYIKNELKKHEIAIKEAIKKTNEGFAKKKISFVITGV